MSTNDITTISAPSSPITTDAHGTNADVQSPTRYSMRQRRAPNPSSSSPNSPSCSSSSLLSNPSTVAVASPGLQVQEAAHTPSSASNTPRRSTRQVDKSSKKDHIDSKVQEEDTHTVSSLHHQSIVPQASKKVSTRKNLNSHSFSSSDNIPNPNKPSHSSSSEDRQPHTQRGSKTTQAACVRGTKKKNAITTQQRQSSSTSEPVETNISFDGSSDDPITIATVVQDNVSDAISLSEDLSGNAPSAGTILLLGVGDDSQRIVDENEHHIKYLHHDDLKVVARSLHLVNEGHDQPQLQSVISSNMSVLPSAAFALDTSTKRAMYLQSLLTKGDPLGVFFDILQNQQDDNAKNTYQNKQNEEQQYPYLFPNDFYYCPYGHYNVIIYYIKQNEPDCSQMIDVAVNRIKHLLATSAPVNVKGSRELSSSLNEKLPPQSQLITQIFFDHLNHSATYVDKVLRPYLDTLVPKLQEQNLLSQDCQVVIPLCSSTPGSDATVNNSSFDQPVKSNFAKFKEQFGTLFDQRYSAVAIPSSNYSNNPLVDASLFTSVLSTQLQGLSPDFPFCVLKCKPTARTSHTGLHSDDDGSRQDGDASIPDSIKKRLKLSLTSFLENNPHNMMRIRPEGGPTGSFSVEQQLDWSYLACMAWFTAFAHPNSHKAWISHLLKHFQNVSSSRIAKIEEVQMEDGQGARGVSADIDDEPSIISSSKSKIDKAFIGAREGSSSNTNNETDSKVIAENFHVHASSVLRDHPSATASASAETSCDFVIDDEVITSWSSIILKDLLHQRSEGLKLQQQAQQSKSRGRGRPKVSTTELIYRAGIIDPFLQSFQSSNYGSFKPHTEPPVPDVAADETGSTSDNDDIMMVDTSIDNADRDEQQSSTKTQLQPGYPAPAVQLEGEPPLSEASSSGANVSTIASQSSSDVITAHKLLHSRSGAVSSQLMSTTHQAIHLSADMNLSSTNAPSSIYMGFLSTTEVRTLNLAPAHTQESVAFISDIKSLLQQQIIVDVSDKQSRASADSTEQSMMNTTVSNAALTGVASSLAGAIGSIPAVYNATSTMTRTMSCFLEVAEALLYIILCPLQGHSREDEYVRYPTPTLFDPLNGYRPKSFRRDISSVWKGFKKLVGPLNRNSVQETTTGQNTAGLARIILHSLLPDGLADFQSWLIPLMTHFQNQLLEVDFVRFFLIIWPVSLKGKSREEQISFLQEIFTKDYRNWNTFVAQHLTVNEINSANPPFDSIPDDPTQLKKLTYWAMNKRLTAFGYGSKYAIIQSDAKAAADDTYAAFEESLKLKAPHLSSKKSKRHKSNRVLLEQVCHRAENLATFHGKFFTTKSYALLTVCPVDIFLFDKYKELNLNDHIVEKEVHEHNIQVWLLEYEEKLKHQSGLEEQLTVDAQWLTDELRKEMNLKNLSNKMIRDLPDLFFSTCQSTMSYPFTKDSCVYYFHEVFKPYHTKAINNAIEDSRKKLTEFKARAQGPIRSMFSKSALIKDGYVKFDFFMTQLSLSGVSFYDYFDDNKFKIPAAGSKPHGLAANSTLDADVEETAELSDNIADTTNVRPANSLTTSRRSKRKRNRHQVTSKEYSDETDQEVENAKAKKRMSSSLRAREISSGSDHQENHLRKGKRTKELIVNSHGNESESGDSDEQQLDDVIKAKHKAASSVKNTKVDDRLTAVNDTYEASPSPPASKNRSSTLHGDSWQSVSPELQANPEAAPTKAIPQKKSTYKGNVRAVTPESDSESLSTVGTSLTDNDTDNEVMIEKSSVEFALLFFLSSLMRMVIKPILQHHQAVLFNNYFESTLSKDDTFPLDRHCHGSITSNVQAAGVPPKPWCLRVSNDDPSPERPSNKSSHREHCLRTVISWEGLLSEEKHFPGFFHPLSNSLDIDADIDHDVASGPVQGKPNAYLITPEEYSKKNFLCETGICLDPLSLKATRQGLQFLTNQAQDELGLILWIHPQSPEGNLNFVMGDKKKECSVKLGANCTGPTLLEYLKAQKSHLSANMKPHLPVDVLGLEWFSDKAVGASTSTRSQLKDRFKNKQELILCLDTSSSDGSNMLTNVAKYCSICALELKQDESVVSCAGVLDRSQASNEACRCFVDRSTCTKTLCCWLNDPSTACYFAGLTSLFFHNECVDQILRSHDFMRALLSPTNSQLRKSYINLTTQVSKLIRSEKKTLLSQTARLLECSTILCTFRKIWKRQWCDSFVLSNCSAAISASDVNDQEAKKEVQFRGKLWDYFMNLIQSEDELQKALLTSDSTSFAYKFLTIKWKTNDLGLTRLEGLVGCSTDLSCFTGHDDVGTAADNQMDLSPDPSAVECLHNLHSQLARSGNAINTPITDVNIVPAASSIAIGSINNCINTLIDKAAMLHRLLTIGSQSVYLYKHSPAEIALGLNEQDVTTVRRARIQSQKVLPSFARQVRTTDNTQYDDAKEKLFVRVPQAMGNGACLYYTLQCLLGCEYWKEISNQEIERRALRSIFEIPPAAVTSASTNATTTSVLASSFSSPSNIAASAATKVKCYLTNLTSFAYAMAFDYCPSTVVTHQWSANQQQFDSLFTLLPLLVWSQLDLNEQFSNNRRSYGLLFALQERMIRIAEKIAKSSTVSSGKSIAEDEVSNAVGMGWSTYTEMLHAVMLSENKLRIVCVHGEGFIKEEDELLQRTNSRFLVFDPYVLSLFKRLTETLFQMSDDFKDITSIAKVKSDEEWFKLEVEFMQCNDLLGTRKEWIAYSNSLNSDLAARALDHELNKSVQQEMYVGLFNTHEMPGNSKDLDSLKGTKEHLSTVERWGMWRMTNWFASFQSNLLNSAEVGTGNKSEIKPTDLDFETVAAAYCHYDPIVMQFELGCNFYDVEKSTEFYFQKLKSASSDPNDAVPDEQVKRWHTSVAVSAVKGDTLDEKCRNLHGIRECVRRCAQKHQLQLYIDTCGLDSALMNDFLKEKQDNLKVAFTNLRALHQRSQLKVKELTAEYQKRVAAESQEAMLKELAEYKKYRKINSIYTGNHGDLTVVMNTKNQMLYVVKTFMNKQGASIKNRHLANSVEMLIFSYLGDICSQQLSQYLPAQSVFTLLGHLTKILDVNIERAEPTDPFPMDDQDTITSRSRVLAYACPAFKLFTDLVTDTTKGKQKTVQSITDCLIRRFYPKETVKWIHPSPHSVMDYMDCDLYSLLVLMLHKDCQTLQEEIKAKDPANSLKQDILHTVFPLLRLLRVLSELLAINLKLFHTLFPNLIHNDIKPRNYLVYFRHSTYQDLKELVKRKKYSDSKDEIYIFIIKNLKKIVLSDFGISVYKHMYIHMTDPDRYSELNKPAAARRTTRALRSAGNAYGSNSNTQANDHSDLDFILSISSSNGTAVYASPETFSITDINQKMIQESDIYSLGVTIISMVLGTSRWHKVTTREPIQTRATLHIVKFQQVVSQKLISLINQYSVVFFGIFGKTKVTALKKMIYFPSILTSVEEMSDEKWNDQWKSIKKIRQNGLCEFLEIAADQTTLISSDEVNAAADQLCQLKEQEEEADKSIINTASNQRAQQNEQLENDRRKSDVHHDLGLTWPEVGPPTAYTDADHDIDIDDAGAGASAGTGDDGGEGDDDGNGDGTG
jgi:hypothetical protein